MTLKKAYPLNVEGKKWTTEARLKAEPLVSHHEVQLLLPFSFHLKDFCFHIWLIPAQSESPNKFSTTGRSDCLRHTHAHTGSPKCQIGKCISAVGSDFKKALGEGVEEKRHDKTRWGVGDCYWSSCYRYRSSKKDRISDQTFDWR